MQRNYTARSPRVERACPTCGAAFTAEPNQIAKGDGKYCSGPCYWSTVKTHGESAAAGNSAEYRIWHTMKERCLNPNATGYAHWGGRGITICPKWCDDYRAFLADVGRRPGPGYSIDRIDNERGYEPGNVRWSTVKEQARNRRSNRLLTFNGETKCVAEWAEAVGLTSDCLLQRVVAGWSTERALTTGPDSLSRAITFQGETHSVAEWARKTGMPSVTLYQRLKNGWSVERALTTPPRPYGNRMQIHQPHPPELRVHE